MSESDQWEAFAAEHGIPALLDHLGLDGLGNKVVSLTARCAVLENGMRSIERGNWNFGNITPGLTVMDYARAVLKAADRA
jgi:hypothetical protein